MIRRMDVALGRIVMSANDVRKAFVDAIRPVRQIFVVPMQESAVGRMIAVPQVQESMRIV